jgi:MFS family permease
VQGTLLGSFYYGYVSSLIIGGVIGDLMSAKWLLLTGTAMTGFLTILIPSAAWLGPHAVVIVRALQGIGSVSAITKRRGLPHALRFILFYFN